MWLPMLKHEYHLFNQTVGKYIMVLKILFLKVNDHGATAHIKTILSNVISEKLKVDLKGNEQSVKKARLHVGSTSRPKRVWDKHMIIPKSRSKQFKGIVRAFGCRI